MGYRRPGSANAESGSALRRRVVRGASHISPSHSPSMPPWSQSSSSLGWKIVRSIARSSVDRASVMSGPTASRGGRGGRRADSAIRFTVRASFMKARDRWSYPLRDTGSFFFKVTSRLPAEFGVVTQVADRQVAHLAEQSAYQSCLVAVIDAQLYLGQLAHVDAAADGAHATLGSKGAFVPLHRDPVLTDAAVSQYPDLQPGLHASRVGLWNTMPPWPISS